MAFICTKTGMVNTDAIASIESPRRCGEPYELIGVTGELLGTASSITPCELDERLAPVVPASGVAWYGFAARQSHMPRKVHLQLESYHVVAYRLMKFGPEPVIAGYSGDFHDLYIEQPDGSLLNAMNHEMRFASLDEFREYVLSKVDEIETGIEGDE